MGIVAFDYQTWQQRYPEFAGVSQPLANLYFGEACLLCDNSDTSPVPCGAPTYQRETLLGMLTAHTAQLNSGPNGEGASPLVGRLSDASEGSVSVSAELNLANKDAMSVYLSQTKYGLAYLAATAGFRRARYRPAPRSPRFGPWRR